MSWVIGCGTPVLVQGLKSQDSRPDHNQKQNTMLKETEHWAMGRLLRKYAPELEKHTDTIYSLYDMAVTLKEVSTINEFLFIDQYNKQLKKEFKQWVEKEQELQTKKNDLTE